MMHEEDRERCRRAMLALMRHAEGTPMFSNPTTAADREVISTLTIALAITTWIMQFEPQVADDAVRDIKLIVDELQEPAHAHLH